MTQTAALLDALESYSLTGNALAGQINKALKSRTDRLTTDTLDKWIVMANTEADSSMMVADLASAIWSKEFVYGQILAFMLVSGWRISHVKP